LNLGWVCLFVWDIDCFDRVVGRGLELELFILSFEIYEDEKFIQHDVLLTLVCVLYQSV